MLENNKKLKILYLLHSSDLGGGERSMLTLISNLDKESFLPVVVLPQEGPLAPMLTDLRVKVYLSPIEWWVNTEFGIGFSAVDLETRLAKLSEIIELEEPSLIHSNTSVICEGALAAKQHGIPHIWHLHEVLRGNPTIFPLLPMSLFYAAIEMLSNRVVVVSDSAKGELKGLIAENKLVRIYNGVEQPPIDRPSVEIRKELGIPHSSIIVLTGATLSRNKDIQTLLKASEQVAKSRTDVKFILAGGGSPDLVAELNAQVAALRLENTFFYLGQREDFRQIVSESDILVVTSVKESFSLTTAEAMSAAKPVISTDCGGPSELIIDGETGYLVEVGDVEAISKRILELAGNEETRETQGRAGFERFANNFTATIFASKFIDLYEEVVQEGTSEASESAMHNLDALIETYQGLVCREKKIAEQKSLLTERENQLRAMEMLIKEHDSLVTERDRQLADQAQQLEMLEKQIWILEKHVENLMNSWSWKVTKPARLLMQLISRK